MIFTHVKRHQTNPDNIGWFCISVADFRWWPHLWCSTWATWQPHRSKGPWRRSKSHHFPMWIELEDSFLWGVCWKDYCRIIASDIFRFKSATTTLINIGQLDQHPISVEVKTRGHGLMRTKKHDRWKAQWANKSQTIQACSSILPSTPRCFKVSTTPLPLAAFFSAMKAPKRTAVAKKTTQTFQNVEEEEVRDFIQRFLSGSGSGALKPAGKGKTEALSFHLRKRHGEHKCASGTFSRTWTSGSLTFYPSTKKLLIRMPLKRTGVNVDILGLWTRYQKDKRPLWQQAREQPEKFHNEKMNSGRYKGQKFQTVYNKDGYLEWLLNNRECFQKTMRMQVFYEYAMALHAAGVSPRPKKPARDVVRDMEPWWRTCTCQWWSMKRCISCHSSVALAAEKPGQRDVMGEHFEDPWTIWQIPQSTLVRARWYPGWTQHLFDSWDWLWLPDFAGFLFACTDPKMVDVQCVELCLKYGRAWFNARKRSKFFSKGAINHYQQIATPHVTHMCCFTAVHVVQPSILEQHFQNSQPKNTIDQTTEFYVLTTKTNRVYVISGPIGVSPIAICFAGDLAARAVCHAQRHSGGGHWGAVGAETNRFWRANLLAKLRWLLYESILYHYEIMVKFVQFGLCMMMGGNSVDSAF